MQKATPPARATMMARGRSSVLSPELQPPPWIMITGVRREGVDGVWGEGLGSTMSRHSD